MKKTIALLSFALALFTLPVVADEESQRPEVAPGNVPEGEVVIRTGDAITVHEYRRNGQIYQVKIIPRKGRPYYLVDSDGDGTLDQIRWVLVRW